jgi:hypothetical protein
MAEKKVDKLLVMGDVVLDWMIATQDPVHKLRDWGDLPNVIFSGQPGGVLQLADLVKSLLVNRPVKHDDSLIRLYANQGAPVPGDPHYNHVYSLVAPYAYGSRSSSEKKRQVWRIAQTLGFESRKETIQPASEALENVPVDQVKLTIIDDLGLDFRHKEASWPKSLLGGQGWTVIKVSQPIAVGALWDKLKTKSDKKLLVITTVQDLRKTAIQISTRISWERTAQDVVWELTYNPVVNTLTQFATLVIFFGCSGAILMELSEDQGLMANLFFDSTFQEGDWEKGYPGGMLGYTNCLTAALVHQILENQETPDFKLGVQSGVAAARKFHQEGYGGLCGSS